MIKNILVPLDGSALAEQALGTASILARAAHASIDLVTVLEPMPFGGFDEAPWNDAEWSSRRQYVESTAAELSTGASVAATGTVMHGVAREKLCEREHAIHADLVVMTSHGRSGMSRAWLGSVADSMVRHSDAPVLVLRPEREAMHPSNVHRSFTHVLIPLDGSAPSADIIASAMELAELAHARVTLLRVIAPLPLVAAYAGEIPSAYTPFVPDDAATQELARVVEGELAETAACLTADSDVTVEAKVDVSAHAAQAIVEFARANDVDLIAMSTHGRGASRLLLGSVADKVLRASGTAMLMHRPTHAESTTALVSERAVCEQLPALGMGK